MAMQELGAKSIQIPSAQASRILKKQRKKLQTMNPQSKLLESKMAAGITKNGRMLLAVQEHLERSPTY